VAKAVVSDPGNLTSKLTAAGRVFTSGFVAHGNASSVLTTLLKQQGLGWSVQDGRIEVLGAGEYIANAAVLLTPDTGLVGTPELGSPDVKTGKSITKVRALLQPLIRPGQRFVVRLRQPADFVRISADQTYVALKVTHHGDTHGGDFYTDIEATPA
jgi:hypothetical protein